MPSPRALLFVVDDTYAVGLAAALASVARHTVPHPKTFVVDAGLSDESKEKLGMVLDIHWLGDVDKLLYMDCDMISLTSLGPLWEVDLGGQLLAAVRDLGHPCGHQCIAQLGWREGSPYFNAGLLLIDVRRLREAAPRLANLLVRGGIQAGASHQGVATGVCRPPAPILGQQGPEAGAEVQGSTGGGVPGGVKEGSHVVACGERDVGQYTPSCLRYHDQDVLNLLCQEEGWVELEHKWNAQGLGSYACFRTRPEPNSPQLFTPCQLSELEAQPRVVHFTGPPSVSPSQYLNPHVPFCSKPWAFLCRHPHRGVFFQLLDTTPWAGWRPSWHSVLGACVSELKEFALRVEAEAASELTASTAAGGQRGGEGPFSAGDFLGALSRQLEGAGRG